MAHFIRGSLYGSVLGDAFGAPFELRKEVSLSKILHFIQSRLSGSDTKELRYTDDSEMAFGICDSMKRMNGFDASDLAKTFSTTFDAAPSCRLYGASIRGLFSKMQANNYKNPFDVSKQQFNGSGSYGNGGGMRITPVALYGFHLSDSHFNDLVCKVTAVTHTNPLALYGALLQAHAIRRVVAIASSNYPVSVEIDPERLVDDLRNDLKNADLSAFAFGRTSNFHHGALQAYLEKLDTVLQFSTQAERPSIADVVSNLGHGEPAIEAIPTALYVFLRCLKPMSDIPFDSILMRCSAYASNIGYDTDTISCMACAIAGGLVGAERIDGPQSPGTCHISGVMFGSVESLGKINEYADWLIDHAAATAPKTK